MGEALPKNWMEVQLIELLNDFQTGVRPKGGVQGIFEGIPSLGGEHLNSDGGFNFKNIKYIPSEFAKGLKRGRIKINDILIVKDGATTGKTSFVNDNFPFEESFVNEHVFICRVFETLNAKYLFYFLRSKKGQDRIMTNFAGAAQGGINTKFASNTLVSLPPFAEQERIVAKLDTVFAQTEVMKKALKRIPQLLKDFRQQVLTQAVTGKLTEKWRGRKGVEEWSSERAVDCCLKVQSGGTPKGSKFSNQGIPFLKVYNIINNKIDFDHEPQYVSEEIHNSQIKKSIAYPGDVIMNIVGPPLNKIAILTDQYPQWNLNQAITIFRVGEKLFNKYLYYFFCEGRSVKSLVNETKGVVGQVNISLSQCRNFDIPIPSIKEQQEIVTRVESLFSKTEKIEEKYKALKAKIESLPQAILHKAFMGKLVEQLPTDGDAKDLLEEIKKLKLKK